MRSFSLVASGLLLVLALAGCLAPGQVPTPPAAGPAAPTPTDAASAVHTASVNVTPSASNATSPGAASIDDWLLAKARAAPGGALTAFTLTIPPGAVHKDRFFDHYDSVDLEISPLLPAGANVSSWWLLVFAAQDGKLAPVLEAGAASGKIASVGPLPGQPGSLSPSLRPTYASILHDVKVGDRLHVVVAFDGPASDAAFGFRFLSAPPALDAAPPKTMDGFVAEQAGRAPFLVPVTGNGTGLHMAMYEEFVGVPLFPISMALTIGDPKVEGAVPLDARPALAARDQTLSTSSPFPRGWSDVDALYFPGGATVGAWDGQVAAGEKTASGGAPIAWSLTAPGGTLTTLALGFPAEMARGDGPKAGASFHVRAASEDADSFEALVIEELDLGATLQDLFGIPAQANAGTEAGLVPEPPVPFLAHAGNDLVMRGPEGVVRVLAGVF